MARSRNPNPEHVNDDGEPMCGAPTRSGGTCQRTRLGADGRCYQHPLDGVRKDTRKDFARELVGDESVLALRARGLTMRQIGEKVGLSAGAVHKALRRAMESAQAERKEQAAELLALELHRLDVMQAALWPEIEKGNHRAIESALKLMKHRATLLGLVDRRGDVNINVTAEQVMGVISMASVNELAGALRTLTSE